MLRFRMTRQQWHYLVASTNLLTRATKPKKERTTEKARKRTFRFLVNGKIHRAEAYTKAEARAIVKRRLKLDRLPVGAGVIQ